MARVDLLNNNQQEIFPGRKVGIQKNLTSGYNLKFNFESIFEN